MMTEEQSFELGKRAMAAGWKWQAGAKTLQAERFVAVYKNGAMVALDSGASVWSEVKDDDTPDFRDPATLGILLAQVREAWNEEGIYAYRAHAPEFGGQWSFNSFRHVRGLPQGKRFGTEAEALVAALEAKQGRGY